MVSIFTEIDQNTWNVSRFASTNTIVHHTAVELEDNMDPEDKENQELKLTTSSTPGSKTAIDSIDNYYFKTKVKPLQVTC